MIIDYITDGTDFTYNDNTGVIVLCKDCKYYHEEWDGTEERFFESYWCEWADTDENDFCSLGVKKGGE